MSDANGRRNVVVWFEIPARDFDRAAGFYETIFGETLKRENFDGKRLGVFGYEQPNVSGCVMEAPELAGREGGTVIYLNCDGRLAEIAGRVEAAGGRLLTPRIDLPGVGAFLHIRDSEGNRVGLHAAR
jgi:predicted enzyme related to lactoylglutathione lyase